jgi:hypothetical protein
MIRSTRFVLAGAAVVLVTGCASGPTPDQIASASYGRDIPLAECTTIGQDLITNMMKDPGSTQFRGTSCAKGYWGSIPLLGMGVQFGWLYQGEVNAKNSYGGYVGFKRFQVLIRDGAVVRYCLTGPDGICTPNGS